MLSNYKNSSNSRSGATAVVVPVPLHDRFKLALMTLMVMLACALLLSGCSKPRTDERPPEPGDVAVARIQGATIWASDVRNEAVAQGLIGEGEPLDITSDMFRRMLEEVIDQKLLAREAVKKGLDRSLTATRRIEAAKERILGDLLVENTVDQAIDEKAVKGLYDEQLKLSKQSEEIRARLILLRSKGEADNILKALQGGSVFEAMAMEKSADQATRLNGGDMGYFTTDVMPQAYKAAINGAKPGALVGPIQVENGWAILRIEDRRPEQPPTMEEARPQILRFLTYDQVKILLTRLREGTKPEMLIKETDGVDREPASAPKEAFSASDDSSSDSASASSSAAPAAAAVKKP